MSSAAQAIANRANAQSSTGPRTVDGKAAASQNSLRHGLTAKTVVIKGEDPAEYASFHQGLLDTWMPANAAELYFANEAVENAWRLRRAHAIETEVFDHLTEECGSLAIVFTEKAKEVSRLSRYLGSIERAFYRALKELEKLQKARRAAEVPVEPIGSVSQKPKPSEPYPCKPLFAPTPTDRLSLNFTQRQHSKPEKDQFRAAS